MTDQTFLPVFCGSGEALMGEVREGFPHNDSLMRKLLEHAKSCSACRKALFLGFLEGEKALTELDALDPILKAVAVFYKSAVEFADQVEVEVES